MGVFSDGTGDYNRELKAQRDRVLREELTSAAIGRSFEDFQGMYAPMLGQMSQAAAVGANMDTQSMQANLARQGLGGTGIGAALGSGLRTGANFAVNNLRARMAQEAMQSALGLRSARANTLMSQAMNMKPEMGAGQYWMQTGLQTAGVAAQTAGLFVGGGGGGGGGMPLPVA